jgi:regulator of protease activity HflC (stomatin/prohibitin superfamily)
LTRQSRIKVEMTYRTTDPGLLLDWQIESDLRSVYGRATFNELLSFKV